MVISIAFHGHSVLVPHAQTPANTLFDVFIKFTAWVFVFLSTHVSSLVMTLTYTLANVSAYLSSFWLCWIPAISVNLYKIQHIFMDIFLTLSLLLLMLITLW